MTHSLHVGEYLGDSLKGQFLRKKWVVLFFMPFLMKLRLNVCDMGQVEII